MEENDLLHGETFRDRVSTVTNTGHRNWIYSLKPSGKWTNYRKILAYFYLVIFFIMPFIKINGLPFMMLNISKGQFILFGKIFWPQDFFIFAVSMITFVVIIVLFTVVFGRLFCGWVCPQTVFMEFVFRPIEWLIEGSPAQQKKLNSAEWTTEKLLKKGIKHVIYLLISFLISHTFLSYILGVDELVRIIHEPMKDHLGMLIGLIIFTFLFYSVFAFVREIVCTTICPYGRLQGVMLDKDSMQIAYDYSRGEPRAKYKKNVDRNEGDCINCLKCVHVCPTGIDIRNGLQMECVGCTACIDACDEVMDALHLDRGLIRYASENEIATGNKFHFNTRMKAYTALTVVCTLFLAVLIVTRKDLETSITRAKGHLYQEVNGNISNLFEAKIINKTRFSRMLTLQLEDGLGSIKIVGEGGIKAEKEQITNHIFFVEIPKDQVKSHSTEITIGVYEGDHKIQTVQTKFVGPF